MAKAVWSAVLCNRQSFENHAGNREATRKQSKRPNPH